MQNLMTFSNPDFGEIRTIEENGAPWFVLKDVCEAFGETNYRRVAGRLEDEEKGVSQIATPGGKQNMTIVNESGLYSALFAMQPEKARGVDDEYIEKRQTQLRQFKRWVTSDVLPSIRKNGGYISGQSELSPAELMAQALKVADRVLAERDARLAALQPKADYFDALVERNTLTNFRETAKELGASPKKFVAFLLDKKYIYRDQRGKLLPYEAKNDGLFTVKECRSDKTPWSGTQTLITPKGRETFRLLYSNTK